MTTDRILPRLVGVATAAAVLPLMSGCIPIPRTWTESPDIDGVYFLADGTPAAGAPVLLSTAANDSTCSRPKARTATDASGRFHFARTKYRESVTVLLPIDRLFCYSICAGQEPFTRPAFDECGLNDGPPPASLECRETTVEGEPAPRVVCERRRSERA